jgi:secreted trypsin-like serine protease
LSFNQPNEALCSGSLISRRAVLTSAICVSRASSITLHFGASNLKVDARYHARVEVPAENIHIHPDFTRLVGVSMYDVAILRLRNPLAIFTVGVNIISLPSEADMTDDFDEEEATIMG